MWKLWGGLVFSFVCLLNSGSGSGSGILMGRVLVVVML